MFIRFYICNILLFLFASFSIQDSAHSFDNFSDAEWRTSILEEWQINDVNNPADQLLELVRTDSLYSYNFLRELAGRSIALNAHEIDYTWLREAAVSLYSEIIMKKWGYVPATNAQFHLIQEARGLLGIKEPIWPYGTDEGGSAFKLFGMTGLALGENSDLDSNRATIFHEFGHIVHNDHGLLSEVQSHEELVRRFSQFPSDSKFNAEVKRVDDHLEVGSHVFDGTTQVGRLVLNTLARNMTYWKKDPKFYERCLRQRGMEKRADLFAFEWLFQLNFLNPILSTIDGYVRSGDVTTVGVRCSHPSNFERALYLSGLLQKKIAHNGTDINALFKEFEDKGSCSDLNQLHKIENLTRLPSPKEGAVDLRLALRNRAGIIDREIADELNFKENWIEVEEALETIRNPRFSPNNTTDTENALKEAKRAVNSVNRNLKRKGLDLLHALAEKEISLKRVLILTSGLRSQRETSGDTYLQARCLIVFQELVEKNFAFAQALKAASRTIDTSDAYLKQESLLLLNSLARKGFGLDSIFEIASNELKSGLPTNQERIIHLIQTTLRACAVVDPQKSCASINADAKRLGLTLWTGEEKFFGCSLDCPASIMDRKQ